MKARLRSFFSGKRWVDLQEARGTGILPVSSGSTSLPAGHRQDACATSAFPQQKLCGAACSPGSRAGSTLFLALLMVLLVSVLGAGLLRLGERNRVEAARRLSGMQAFWAAEGGAAVARAVAHRNMARKDGTEAFSDSDPRQWTTETEKCTYTVDVADDKTSSTPGFAIRSEAVSHGNATRIVSLLLRQMPALSLGLFGNKELTLNASYPSPVIDSYRVGQPPNADGGAFIGSNGNIGLRSSSMFALAGAIVRGANADETQTAVIVCPWSNCGALEVDSRQAGHLDPDPLGILGEHSTLRHDFLAAEVSNDNYGAGVTNSLGAALIVNNRLTVNEDATLPSGIYYLVRGRVRNGAVLSVEGNVTIYLHGTFRLEDGCTIQVPGDDPRQFAIYSDDESSSPTIDLRPAGDFTGFIYAPYTEVSVIHEGRLRGVIWADKVDIWAGGAIQLNLDLQDYGAFDAYRLETVNWSEGGPA